MNETDQSMTCKEVDSFLMDYLEGELGPREKLLFEGHLGECASCARYMEQYQRTIQLGRDALASGPDHGDDPATGHVPAGLLDAIKAARQAHGS